MRCPIQTTATSSHGPGHCGGWSCTRRATSRWRATHASRRFSADGWSRPTSSRSSAWSRPSGEGFLPQEDDEASAGGRNQPQGVGARFPERSRRDRTPRPAIGSHLHHRRRGTGTVRRNGAVLPSGRLHTALRASQRLSGAACRPTERSQRPDADGAGTPSIRHPVIQAASEFAVIAGDLERAIRTRIAGERWRAPRGQRAGEARLRGSTGSDRDPRARWPDSAARVRERRQSRAVKSPHGHEIWHCVPRWAQVGHGSFGSC